MRRRLDGVRLLGTGELKAKLDITVTGASKGAIDALTEGLAQETAGQGIRVNAVRPGVVDTEIHASGGLPDKPEQAKAAIPLGRVGQPEDMAAAIHYLASDASSYMTGQCLIVDGGITARGPL